MYEPSGKRLTIDVAVVVPSGSFTLNDASPVPTASFKISVSWSNILNPLTSIFSPATPEIDSLSDKPCFRMYFASVSEVVVLAANCVIPTTDVTTKSPRFASLLFNILNLLPTASPWSTVVVNVVVPDVVAVSYTHLRAHET